METKRGKGHKGTGAKKPKVECSCEFKAKYYKLLQATYGHIKAYPGMNAIALCQRLKEGGWDKDHMQSFEYCRQVREEPKPSIPAAPAPLYRYVKIPEYDIDTNINRQENSDPSNTDVGNIDNNGQGRGHGHEKEQKKCRILEVYKVFVEIIGELFFNRYPRSFPSSQIFFLFCAEQWAQMPIMHKEYFSIVYNHVDSNAYGSTLDVKKKYSYFSQAPIALKLAHNVAQMLIIALDDGEGLARKVCSVPNAFYWYREEQTFILTKAEPSLSYSEMKKVIEVVWAEMSNDARKKYDKIVTLYIDYENSVRDKYARPDPEVCHLEMETVYCTPRHLSRNSTSTRPKNNMANNEGPPGPHETQREDFSQSQGQSSPINLTNYVVKKGNYEKNQRNVNKIFQK